MKKLHVLLIAAASLLLTQVTSAEGYWGIKAASTNTGASGSSSAINAGVYLGADFMELGSSPVAAELDISTRLLDGKVGGNNWGTQTMALYAAMRSGSDSFFKLKLGYHSSTITVNSSNTSTSGLAYGIGFGFDSYEIEYSLLTASNSADALTMISVGYTFE